MSGSTDNTSWDEKEWLQLCGKLDRFSTDDIIEMADRLRVWTPQYQRSRPKMQYIVCLKDVPPDQLTAEYERMKTERKQRPPRIFLPEG